MLLSARSFSSIFQRSYIDFILSHIFLFLLAICDAVGNVSCVIVISALRRSVALPSWIRKSMGSLELLSPLSDQYLIDVYILLNILFAGPEVVVEWASRRSQRTVFG